MKTISELELKFALPLNTDLKEIGAAVLQYIDNKGWKVILDENVVKEVIYYDTGDYKFAREGSTLRRVKNPKTFNKNKKYRYDFKRGEGSNRIERTSWQSQALDMHALKEIFYIQDSIKESGRALKRSRKITFSPGNDGDFTVEASVDEMINLDDITVLKELEFELKKGNPAILDELRMDFVEKGYNFHTTQKYTQLISI